MLDVQRLFAAVLFAAAVTALSFLALRWVNRPAWRAIGGVLATAGALLIGEVILGFWPSWSLAEDRDRYLLIVVPAVVGVELLAAVVTRRWLIWAARGLVAVAVAPVLLWGSVYLSGTDWTATTAAYWLIGSAVLLLAVWAAVLPLARGAGSTTFSVGLGVVVAGSVVAIALAGSLVVGLQGVPLVAALCGIAVGSIGGKHGTEGWLGVALVSSFGLLARGHWFCELPAAGAVGLFLVPLLFWISEIPWSRLRQPVVRGVVRAHLILVPTLAILAALWWRDTAPPPIVRSPEASAQDYLDFGK